MVELSKETALAIFEHIKHGDEAHQKWLKEKLLEMVPVPSTRELRQNPRKYCQCGREKYEDALTCSVCWQDE